MHITCSRSRSHRETEHELPATVETATGTLVLAMGDYYSTHGIVQGYTLAN